MKTRADLIQSCCYPILPEKSGSLYHFYNSNNKAHLTKQWLGGRITGEAKADTFSISAQLHEIKCFVSAECRLFFDFDENAKHVAWKEVSSLLREGDHLLVQLDSDWRKNIVQHNSLHEIRNIKKLILISVNKTDKMLSSSSAVVREQQSWFDFLEEVHRGMKELGLKRVATPTLVDCPGTEPDLDLFETELYSPSEVRKKIFLTSSPEMYMKRLLCRGWADIYEVKKCFRNKEIGQINHSEFYLLEWYRAYASLNILIEDLQSFLNFLSEKITGSSFPQLKKVSMQELFKKRLNMELRPSSSKEDFIHELKKKNIPFEKSWDIEDLFYLLFLNEIEPHLDHKTPLIIYDYPPFQKAYARIGPRGWASRFELFWKGMELANAFDEVIGTEEQKERFEEDAFKRQKRGKQAVPPAHKLLDDMQAGMPPSSGIALGLDRLFLAFKDLNSIDQIRLFV